MDGTLAIDYRPIGDLIPYARNARTHSEAQVALIADSIREYGFTNPVLVDGENGIIAGHGRVMAARKLGLPQVPVIELAHLTEAQKRAYILADNKLAEQAGWDRELLALELGDLQDMAVDLTSLGFDAAELNALLRSGDADEREDDIPAVPVVPASQPGDLWLLGNHRLICGDATDAATVAKVLNGVRPHLLVSDPPYGVEYDPAWRNQVGAAKTKRVGKVLNDHRADWREAWGLFPGDVAYVWHGALHATTFSPAASRSGARSSGPRNGWCSPGGTTTGSMNLAGMPFGRKRRGIGRATVSRRPFGPSRAGTRMPPRCTERRNPWSACAVRC